MQNNIRNSSVTECDYIEKTVKLSKKIVVYRMQRL